MSGSSRHHTLPVKLSVRHASVDDIPGIIAVARAAYPGFRIDEASYTRSYTLQLRAFPTGQYVAVANGEVIGYTTSLIVQLDDESPWYSYAEITGNGSFSTHNPAGDTLYGADIAVHPDWQGKGVSDKLYRARKALLKRHNLKQMVAGGRIPGYAACYDSHLLVFPEFVSTQLFSTFGRGISLIDAVNRLADMADEVLNVFTEAAQRHKLYIVSGTTPVRREGRLYNVAHFHTPTGSIYSQDKLHITPAEREGWQIQPGERIRVFETPLGRLAIVVCYDIEFPELTRILVEHGVDIILTPFATDERKSYLRVRYCAQARAVENMLYVVLSGNVGGLTHSPAMFLNYGQAAICTPSDFAFPMDGVAAEGVVNTPTVVIGDLDLGALDIQRQTASVRPLLDRRHDIYELVSKLEIERVVIR